MESRSQIVATLGPASRDQETIKSLIQGGVNVFRMNFSHGTHDEHLAALKTIRNLSKELFAPVAVLQDLQGPKIRVSKLENPVEIKDGQKVIIGKDFTMDFDVSKDVKKGHRVLIQDGLLELVVDKVVGSLIHCTVRNGGLVKSHKGMNFPDTRITARIMTDKDIADAKFGLQQDVDYSALS